MHRFASCCLVGLLLLPLSAECAVEHFVFGLDATLEYDVTQGDELIAEHLVPGQGGDIRFDADEVSPIHIYPSGQVGDAGPPAPVEDFEASGPTYSGITLTWTATGDDGSEGQAASYDIRYATTAITDSTWVTASQVDGESYPRTAGQDETFSVEGLSPGTLYYFAVKVSDEVPNRSGISNVPSCATLPPEGMSTPPEGIEPSGPIAESIEGPFPNPSTGRICMRIFSDKESKIRVQVFDPQGRLCDESFDGLSAPGLWKWRRDLGQVNGLPSASGVYFIRVETSRITTVRKLVVGR